MLKVYTCFAIPEVHQGKSIPDIKKSPTFFVSYKKSAVRSIVHHIMIKD